MKKVPSSSWDIYNFPMTIQLQLQNPLPWWRTSAYSSAFLFNNVSTVDDRN